MINDGKYMTGVAGDMGRIAANNPNAARINAKYEATTTQKFKRNSPLGLVGAGIAGTAGMGIEGAITGAAIGGGINEILRRAYANRMTSPEFQKSNVVPPDFRNRLNPPMFTEPQVNMLRPVEPGQSNIVPFDPRNALLDPEIRPNFVFGRPDPYVQPSMPSGPPQLPAPSPQSTLASVASEEARRTRMAKMAEAEGLAAESAAPRAPAREGINTLYELDPITKKLVPVDQSVRGPVDLGGVPSTLRSAVDKLSGQTSTYTPTITEKVNTGAFYRETSGGNVKGAPIYEYVERPGTPITERSTRAFDLTAPELAVWKNTRANLDQLDPRYKGLSDKEITNRMLDRKWVEDAVIKAREKSASFYQLAVRARDAERMGARADTARNAALAQQAEEASGQMRTTLELLENQLSNLRPDTSGKRQGPKTQGAIRNNLTANQNRNKLREE
jgi:hypothetical protein